MKITKELIAVAMLGLFPTAVTWAAQGTVSDEPAPAANQEANDSPSDLEAPDEPAQATVGDACGVDVACDGKAGACYDPSGMDPWELFPETCGGLNIGGWFQMGYHTEGTNGNGTGMFNNYPNVFQLHQAWVYAEKQAENNGYGWDWGFRMDYVYGTDGQDTQAFGNDPNDWDNSWNAGGFYGHAIPQLYAELAYNDLTAKIGHFYTILGYEVVAAPANFFYSHAFTMVNAEPFTHTGVLVDYALNDGITLSGGWATGWDTGFAGNGGDIFLGGVNVQLSDSISVAYGTTMGDFGFDPPTGPGSDRTAYSHSIVVDVQLTERLNYVIQQDYLDNDILKGGVGVLDKAWGVNQYLIYQINDVWAAGLRYEYYEDERAPAFFPAFAGQPAPHVNSLTFGLNIKPRPNLILRPEVRFDDFDPASGLRDTTILGIDGIITF